MIKIYALALFLCAAWRVSNGDHVAAIVDLAMAIGVLSYGIYDTLSAIHDKLKEPGDERG